MTPHTTDRLHITYVCRRSGLTAATLRFYEEQGLIQSAGRTGGKRVYHRHVLRRLAFIAAAQRVGLSLAEINAALAPMPIEYAPTPADWNRLSEPWKRRVDAAINSLQVLRTSLDECIGCGCLSMRTCSILNPEDEAAVEGSGPRWLRPNRSQ
ncbi:redox-sensitive transcriptional activator SoxR [Arthrobacter sp. Bz4]|uniref:redox-sensitive transcriptional activator SoxR n=1 Tax=Arthrobacter sp. Bz4 TaxID=2171979 RepID=UPI000D518FF5|nr:redox-sensitive transcriptional activator SoxR [Arthrobacter sp. Bz4]PVE14618.1 redox-sensitive transcriptional activator SoxR [Arthrobacter sp. Bz4]